MELNSTQEPFHPSSDNGCAVSKRTILDMLPGTPLQSCYGNRSAQSQKTNLSREIIDEPISSIFSGKPNFCHICNASIESLSPSEILAHRCEKYQQISDQTFYKSNALENPFGSETAANACAVSNETISYAIPGTSQQSCHRDKCDQFSNSGLFNFNMADETSSNLYSCDNCNMSFESVSCLEMLNHSCEPGQQITDKAIHESCNFEDSIGSQTEKKGFQCNECRKVFSTKSSLKIHMIKHAGEKPYVCEECDKAFYTNHELTVHMRIHTGERPYQCQDCDKSFLQSCHLKDHILTHTGERPYQCQDCDKSFSQSHNLKDHMLSHTGERPYRCEFCEKCFRRKWTLKCHMRTHTG